MQKLLFSAKNQSKILWKHLAERGNLYTSRLYYSKKHKIINISKNIHFRNQCLIAFSLHCYSKNSYKDNIKNGKKMKKVKIFYVFLVILKKSARFASNLFLLNCNFLQFKLLYIWQICAPRQYLLQSLITNDLTQPLLKGEELWKCFVAIFSLSSVFQLQNILHFPSLCGWQASSILH